MSFGWSGKILRIDLSEMRSMTEDTEPYTHSFIGGKGINLKIMYDEVGTEVTPFDPANRICFGPGVLAGTLAPASSRTKVTSMSTNGLIASSGLGGYIGAAIRHAGYDNLVIQGTSDKPVYLNINDDLVEFKDASPISGLGTQETQRAIKEEVGESAVVMSIGPGGENLVSSACIMTGMGSAAGRHGIGAIMGAKNLKGIAVKGTHEIRIAKMEEFIAACLRAQKTLLEDPSMKTQGKDGVGDKYTLNMISEVGLLPLGNWEEENAEWDKRGGFDSEGGDRFWNHYAIHQYGCFGCPVNHFHVFDVPGIGCGTTKCNGWEAFASNVWNNDRKVIFHANYICTHYGLDVISIGNIISFLMELYHKGIITEKDTDGLQMRRGDGGAIINTIHKIGMQEGFGKLFRNGVLGAARMIGRDAEECAMVVKGLEMEAYEYRAYKSLALAAALTTGSPSDGPPLDCFYLEEPTGYDPTSYEEKAQRVWDYRNRVTAVDMLGTCKWLIPWTVESSLEMPAKLFSLATGVDTSEADLLFAAQRVETLERAFNVRKGVRRKDDTLPKRLFETAASGLKVKGQELDRVKFENMIDEYYSLRGWGEDGIPTEETFKKFDLLSEWEIFKKEPRREVKSLG